MESKIIKAALLATVFIFTSPGLMLYAVEKDHSVAPQKPDYNCGTDEACSLSAINTLGEGITWKKHFSDSTVKNAKVVADIASASGSATVQKEAVKVLAKGILSTECYHSKELLKFIAQIAGTNPDIGKEAIADLKEVIDALSERLPEGELYSTVPPILESIVQIAQNSGSSENRRIAVSVLGRLSNKINVHLKLKGDILDLIENSKICAQDETCSMEIMYILDSEINCAFPIRSGMVVHTMVAITESVCTRDVKNEAVTGLKYCLHDWQTKNKMLGDRDTSSFGQFIKNAIKRVENCVQSGMVRYRAGECSMSKDSDNEVHLKQN